MQIKIAFIFIVISFQSLAQKDSGSQNFNIHFQATTIPQYHFPFSAKYTGQNSLQTTEAPQTSFTTTFYTAAKLWKNATAIFNYEASGGSGLSGATGMAGFPNGETFRIGSTNIKAYLARLYLEQKFPLNNETETTADELNQLRGKVPTKYISIRAGKFSLADFFDDNAISHDPRTQFLNWSLMGTGAWDYPANTRGYTVGFILEYHDKNKSLQLGAAQMPTVANGPVLDGDISKSFGLVLEAEHNITIGQKPGRARVLAFYNQAPMGNYLDAINQGAPPNITSTRKNGRTKFGLGINIEQQISNTANMFARASFNDGKNETWAFTEIDESISAGLVLAGKKWKREDDELGFALVANGISNDHKNYLKAGGYGFIIGDGFLNYSPEIITEIYYKCSFPKMYLSISPNVQYAINPAYNADRGPVLIFGLRGHLQL